MAAKATDPVVFELPDGDNVSLITWDYVLDKLDKEFVEIFNSMNSINTDLQRINTKLDDYIPEE